jgi:hypothetical protein
MLPEDHKMGTIDPTILMKFIEFNGGYLKYGSIVVLSVLGLTVTRLAANIYIQIWC